MMELSPCSKAHGNPSPRSKDSWENFGGLCAYYLDRVCYRLSLPLLCCLYSYWYLALLGQSRARPGPCKLKVPWMILFFSKLFQEVKPSFLPSTSINHPDVVINPGHFRTHNHVPRETATFTLSMLVKVVESNESCLHNCSGVVVSDQQRLKKIGKLCLISRSFKKWFLEW